MARPVSARRANDDETGMGPTASRMVLGAQLRRLREAADITRVDAGYAVRSSQSKISRLELGRVSFKERDVADLLTLYGVTEPGQREVYLELVKRSNRPGWWYGYTDLMPEWFQDYVGLEESAQRIQTYELQFVPGLLQTRDYAHAVAMHGWVEPTTRDAERRVALRMERQRLLFRQNAPKLWAVIDESVLHRKLGGREVMLAQIDHLLEVTRNPNITLQIVPYRNSGYAAEGSFTLLRFADPMLPDLVYIEHLAGAIYLERPAEIEVYRRAIDRLTVHAETPEATRHLLLKLRTEI
jgi:transcriptional regulator with XRE-family HTH domain